MINAIEVKVPFHDHEILTVIKNEEKLAPLKPICEVLGLDWSAQRRLIFNDEVLSSVVVVTTTTGADEKKYDMLCLPIEYLNGWLFKINPKRYKGSIKNRIIEYQRECCKVLYNYFNHGGAINPNATDTEIIILKARIEYLEQYKPKNEFGAISEINGRKRKNPVRGYDRSDARKPHEMHRNQPELANFPSEVLS